MPMYAFKGVSGTGKTVNGVRDADSPKTLRQILRKDGVLVTSFELSRGGKLAKEANAKKGGLSRDVDLGGIIGGVKKVEIAAFTRQMATLIKAGIPLAETLGALVDQVQNVRFKTPLSEVRSAVNEGSSLADALGKHPKLFDDLYVSMVRDGPHHVLDWEHANRETRWPDIRSRDRHARREAAVPDHRRSRPPARRVSGTQRLEVSANQFCA